MFTIGAPIVLYVVGPRIGRPRLLAHAALAAVVALASFFLGELVFAALALALKLNRDVGNLLAQLAGVPTAVAGLWLTFRRRRFGLISPKRKPPVRWRNQLPRADKKSSEPAGTCARCRGALGWFRKDNGVEKSLPRTAACFCTSCGALVIESTQRLSSPWRFRVPELGRFEARTPPASGLHEGLRRLGIFLDVALVLAAVGQLSENPVGAGKTLGSAFMLWLFTPRRARDVLVTVKDASSREDLVIADTRDGTSSLDSRSVRELWVRAASDESGSRFELVATLRDTSEIVSLVANLTATDAVNLAEHLAACLELPAPTRVTLPPQP